MNIKNIVQASANIVRITELTKGNVVKFVDGEIAKYAVVTDLLNDGNNAFVELLVIDSNYWSGVDLKNKVLGGDKDFAMFPVTPQEFTKHITEIEEAVMHKIQEKKAELAKLEKGWSFAKNIIEGKEVQFGLSEPKAELIA